MLPDDFVLHAKILELSPIPYHPETKSVPLTPELLRKFNEIFKSLTLLNPNELIYARVSKEFEYVVNHCDLSSPANKTKLLHLSHLILNHFSSESVSWIVAIYNRMMGLTPQDTKMLSEQVSRFTCVDIAKVAPQTENLETKYKYAQLLVRLMADHVAGS